MSAFEGSKWQERREDERKYQQLEDERQRRMDELAQRLAPKWLVVTSPSDIPKTQHWAIIKYPDSSVTSTVEYVAYGSRSDWEMAIAQLEMDGVREYSALEVKPAAITRTIAVTV